MPEDILPVNRRELLAMIVGGGTVSAGIQFSTNQPALDSGCPRGLCDEELRRPRRPVWVSDALRTKQEGGQSGLVHQSLLYRGSQWDPGAQEGDRWIHQFSIVTMAITVTDLTPSADCEDPAIPMYGVGDIETDLGAWTSAFDQDCAGDEWINVAKDVETDIPVGELTDGYFTLMEPRQGDENCDGSPRKFREPLHSIAMELGSGELASISTEAYRESVEGAVNVTEYDTPWDVTVDGAILLSDLLVKRLISRHPVGQAGLAVLGIVDTAQDLLGWANDMKDALNRDSYREVECENLSLSRTTEGDSGPVKMQELNFVVTTAGERSGEPEDSVTLSIDTTVSLNTNHIDDQEVSWRIDIRPAGPPPNLPTVDGYNILSINPYLHRANLASIVAAPSSAEVPHEVPDPRISLMPESASPAPLDGTYWPVGARPAYTIHKQGSYGVGQYRWDLDAGDRVNPECCFQPDAYPLSPDLDWATVEDLPDDTSSGYVGFLLENEAGLTSVVGQEFEVIDPDTLPDVTIQRPTAGGYNVNETIQLKCRASSPKDTNSKIVSYEWDLVDSETGERIPVSRERKGSFDASVAALLEQPNCLLELTVTDDQGNSGVDRVELWFFGDWSTYVADDSITIQSPHNSDSVRNGESINLRAQVEIGGGNAAYIAGEDLLNIFVRIRHPGVEVVHQEEVFSEVRAEYEDGRLRCELDESFELDLPVEPFTISSSDQHAFLLEAIVVFGHQWDETALASHDWSSSRTTGFEQVPVLPDSPAISGQEVQLRDSVEILVSPEGLTANASATVIEGGGEDPYESRVELDASGSGPVPLLIRFYEWTIYRRSPDGTNEIEVATREGEFATWEGGPNRGGYRAELEVIGWTGQSAADDVEFTFPEVEIEGPTANASATVIEGGGEAPYESQVDLSASGSAAGDAPIKSYKWTIYRLSPDGTSETEAATLTGKAPSWEAGPNQGGYRADLEVVDGNGQSDDDEVAFTFPEIEIEGPTASASSSVDAGGGSGTYESKVTLDASGSSAGDAPIESYEWTIYRLSPDGTNETEAAKRSGKTATWEGGHNRGGYRADLEVIDKNDRSGSASTTFTFPEIEIEGPTASASSSVDAGGGSGKYDSKVKLAASGSSAGDAPIESYEWTIYRLSPDGTSETEVTSLTGETAAWEGGHNRGGYRAEVEVVDGNGRSDTASTSFTFPEIEIEGPTASASSSVDAGGGSGTYESKVKLDASGSSAGDASITGYEWTIYRRSPDGTSETATATRSGKSATWEGGHNRGGYRAEVEVVDGNGRSDTASTSFTFPEIEADDGGSGGGGGGSDDGGSDGGSGGGSGDDGDDDDGDDDFCAAPCGPY